MNILVTTTATPPAWAVEELKSLGHEVVTLDSSASVDAQKTRAALATADIYMTSACAGAVICSAEILQQLPHLKAFVFLGTGYQSYIDAAAAKRRQIAVLNTPGANARATAELTLLLMLMAARKTAAMLHDIDRQVWNAPFGNELEGKTLGLIGSGNIAQIVATLATNFGMKVAYWSRSGVKAAMSGAYASFDDVIATADILSLHVPDSAGQLINAAALARMKKSALLINAARAALVDADALYECLQRGGIQCAAYDGFYVEGAGAWQTAQIKLCELGPDKFFMLPHAGFGTHEAEAKMLARAIEHVRDLSAAFSNAKR